MGKIIPLLTVIPFLLMLASIAVFPLFSKRFWEFNFNKLLVTLIIALPTAVWLLYAGFGEELYGSLVFDYIPFIILLGSLYVITGGIFIDGDIEARPVVNTSILALSAVLASLMGTTGAAILMIRILLHTNKERNFKTHTVLYFIAIAANCGGLLTPIGDPPLFMIYLRGVPFLWFLKMFPEWLFVNGFLLLVYFLTDKYYWEKEPAEQKNREKSEQIPVTLNGKLNFVWLVGVMLAVALINKNTFPQIETTKYMSFLREAGIILFALLSWFTTRKSRQANNFLWDPIEEVAYLFFGIFITMVPCLLYLESNANTFGISSATMFYFATGGLSSFLDNTPTAVTFYSLAKGLAEQPAANFLYIDLINGLPQSILKGICMGAVFFGSMTYIGNGPNFMVKSIAEGNGIKMPHFFEYIYKFSLIVLLPVFILAWIIFSH